MTDFAVAVWGLGIAGWLVFVLYVFWIARQVWKDTAMRCPETGSITLVGVDYTLPRDGDTPELTVQRCGLWPERKDCARGCLARYAETAPGYLVKLDALRPFEQRQSAA